MRHVLLVGQFIVALVSAMMVAGSAAAQDEEKSLEKLYNEIAAGKNNSSETGDDIGDDQRKPDAEPVADGYPEADGDEDEDEEEDSNAESLLNPYSEADDEMDDDDEPSARSTGSRPWEKGGKRRHSSLNGATGLFHIIEAGTSEQGTLGGGFHGAFFKYSDYLYYGDKQSSMWSGLNLRVTPLSFLEFYIGAQTYSNHNNFGSPELYQTIGNIEPGIKAFFSASDWIDVAGLLGARFKNPVGGVDLSLKGTSIDLGFLTTFDFSRLNADAPFRAHLNIGYLFDNSAKTVEAIEKGNGGCNHDMDGDGIPDFGGCLNPIEKKALGINRTDLYRVGVGVDVLFPYVSPFVEYWLDIPVNRQDYICAENLPGNTDSCMAIEGFGGVHQWLTLGVRVLPPVDSLAIDLGFDIGLTGWGPTVQELMAQDPYRFIFGLSYSFDMQGAVVRTPVCDAPVTPVLEPEVGIKTGVIHGYVHDSTDPKKQIKGAVITYMGTNLASQESDSNGKFSSPGIPIGAITIAINANGYQSEMFHVTIPEPGEPNAAPGKEDIADPFKIEIEQDFALDPKAAPVPKTSALMVRIVDIDNQPIRGAVVSYDGPKTGKGSSDSEGKLSFDLGIGAYALTVAKDGYLMKAKSVKIVRGAKADVEIVLVKKPAISSVVIKNKRIVIKRKIHFKTGSDTIKEDSFYLLDQIADVLMANPQVKKVEIQGHTDNVGKRSYNMNLSDKRTKSVLNYLVDAGIDRNRLQSKGFGPSRPVAPNVTRQGRARNRRVEFHILEREE